MKVKFLNSLVIIVIGVSLVFLLGIFTKAFGHRCNESLCTESNVILYQYYNQNDNLKRGNVLGYLQKNFKVNKIQNLRIEDLSDVYSLVEIKGDSNNKFLIKETQLKCKEQNPNDCKTKL
ncbi:hypothetical protein [Moorena sp. SIO3H5]|uniref:hypothetical protein n=1 Tax=Moorena sp. SIO3H5 TaxID=2607834 RepID=UPI0013BB2500|nr:hypothetical protein [Moorena sp. SIO3H5]NEO68775.1 hypothetical protein [Moorena sp. SIO3H5]